MRLGALPDGMRALFLFPVLLGLAACQSVVRTNADGFAAGPAGIEAYERDAQACADAAQDPLDGDVRLHQASRYDRNRVYNRLFARCMTGRGHPPRSFWENVLPGG